MNQPLTKFKQDIRKQYIQGHITEAIVDQQQLINDPNYSATVDDYKFLGLMYYAKGEHKKSCNLMKQAYKKWPEDPEPLMNIGVLYNKMKKYEESEKWLKKGLKEAPNKALMHDSLAHCYGAQGKLKEAKKHGEASLKIKDKEAEQQKAIPKITQPIPKFSYGNPQSHIISFSLWGNNPRYTEGALKNAQLIPHIYPGWQCRIYCDQSTVPERIIIELMTAGAQIILMPKQQKMHEGLFWRFYVANDPKVKRYLIRDIDSLVNIKEKAAVDEWITSNKHFHILRDFYTHTDPILAGLWGGIGGVLPDLKTLMEKYVSKPTKNANCDQWMLREAIWPIIRQSVIIHDSWFKALGAKPYPKHAALLPGQHVGQNAFAVSSDLVRFKPGSVYTPNLIKAPKRKQMIFTLTTGRSGTTYLAKLLKQNLTNAEIHHERTGYPNFNIHAQDASDLMIFNHEGNTPEVRHFWQRKFVSIVEGNTPTYAELSHFLAKGGLIENLDLLGKDVTTDIIILKRDPKDIVWSFANRGDFTNPGFTWLFTLDSRYPKNIIKPKIFEPYGVLGKCYWYVCEMWTRAEYYQCLYGNKENINFHQVNLTDIATQQGAQAIIEKLTGKTTSVQLPEKTNKMEQGTLTDKHKTLMEKMIDKIQIDYAQQAQDYLAKRLRIG